MKFPLLIALITALDIAALVTARYYVDHMKHWVLVLSLSIFAISAFVYVQLMEFAVTAIINVLYAAFSTIFITLFYFLVFKERITRGQWVGILIALLGIIMLEM